MNISMRQRARSAVIKAAREVLAAARSNSLQRTTAAVEKLEAAMVTLDETEKAEKESRVSWPANGLNDYHA